MLQQELCLPPDKLADLLAIVQDWLSKTKYRKRELLSLLGTMNFACKAVPAGLFFIRRLIDLSTKARLPHHFLSLNQQFRLDLAWWNRFLLTWNGRWFFLDSEWRRSPDMNLFTDASTNGFGAFYNGAWLAGEWVCISSSTQ